MAATTIANLWTPQVWIEAVREKMALIPNFVNSNALVRLASLDGLASGPGTAGQVPTWKDITDDAEDIQVEGTAPTINNITAGVQTAPILNRVKAYGATALSAAVSGGDPVGEISMQLATGRVKRMGKAMLAAVRGAFAGSGATGAAAALSAVRRDIFLETTVGQTAANLISADEIINTKALMGQRGDDLRFGAILMHSQIRAALEKLDHGSFKNGVESGLPFTVETYKGIPIFTSDNLVRAGTTSGFVYETYLCAPGVIGWGEKPQVGDQIDAASLNLDKDAAKNDQIIYDRRRYVVHLNGMKWGGTPAGQSPTDVELAVPASWTLIYSSAPRVGIALLRTNG